MRRTQRYLVGFDEDGQTVYGRDEGKEFRWTDPMTLREAQQQLKKIDGGIPKTIYKLVPVRGKKA